MSDVSSKFSDENFKETTNLSDVCATLTVLCIFLLSSIRLFHAKIKSKLNSSSKT